MLVDARETLFGAAANRVAYANELLSDDLATVDEPLRSYYLHNRLVMVTGLLSEAVQLIEIGKTKA